MLHLLKLEWLKVRQYKIFRVMVIFYIILLPAILLVTKTFNHIPEDLLSKESLYMFPTVWGYLGYIGNWLSFFFLGFLSVIIVTVENSNKTFRQNIITGLSRTEYFKAKVLFIIAICLAATLYYVLVGLAIGFTNTDTIYFSKIVQEIDLIPRFFLMSFGYMSFGFFLGVIIKKTGIALFIYLIYIMFIESVIRGIHMYYVRNISMHLYPMNANEDLVPIPFAKLAEEFLKENEFSLFLDPGLAAITVSVYTSIFLFLAYRKIKYSDI
jgi:ABC-2 type transport system permease protein